MRHIQTSVRARSIAWRLGLGVLAGEVAVIAWVAIGVFGLRCCNSGQAGGPQSVAEWTALGLAALTFLALAAVPAAAAGGGIWLLLSWLAKHRAR